MFSLERVQRAADLIREALAVAAGEGVDHAEIHAALVALVEASARALDRCGR